MPNRRPLRILLTGLAAAVALAGLAGCRTSPNVAAYVGNEEISVGQLESAINQRTGDPAVAEFARAHPADFPRQVLSVLVQQRIYASAAKRYGVSVDDGTVQRRITELLAGTDPAAAYGQLAAQGLGRQDVGENVRQQLIRQRLAGTEGLDKPLSEQSLRARYEQVRGGLAQKQLGIIVLPDQAAADAALAQLTANPGSYPAVAAQHPSPNTLPALRPTSSDQVPPQLASRVAAAPPNTGFTLALPAAGGVVVAFVGSTMTPPFEEVRPQLLQEAQRTVDAEGRKRVDEVTAGMHITVNPRYGVLKDGAVTPPSGGVVQLLGGSGPDGSGEPAAG